MGIRNIKIDENTPVIIKDVSDPKNHKIIWEGINPKQNWKDYNLYHNNALSSCVIVYLTEE